MNVLGVRDSKWEKDGQAVTTYWLKLEGHDKEIPCYDARAQDLKVGEALPDGWTIAQSKAGKDYLKPPAKQGNIAQIHGKREYVPRYTDTEAGWRANDERVDRRAALAAAQAEGSGITTELAEKFYKWLRQTVPASGIEGHGGFGHPTARGKDSSAPKGSVPAALHQQQASPGAGSSSGSPPENRSGSPVSGVARGESDATSAPRSGAIRGSQAAASEPSVDEKVGADTSSIGGLTEGVGPIGGSNEDRGGTPAVSGKGPGTPCLHLTGIFEKSMANGDRVSYCLDCKAKLEVVKA